MLFIYCANCKLSSIKSIESFLQPVVNSSCDGVRNGWSSNKIIHCYFLSRITGTGTGFDVWTCASLLTMCHISAEKFSFVLPFLLRRCRWVFISSNYLYLNITINLCVLSFCHFCRSSLLQAETMAESQSYDNNTCVLCFKSVVYYSIGECDHPVCFECSTRMRVLCLRNECPICRQNLLRVSTLTSS